MKRFSSFFVLYVFLVVSLVFPPSSSAYYNNMSASVVVGQPDFTSSGTGLSVSALNGPDSIIIVNNRLFVVDNGNNRVLIWNNIPTQNNTLADVVLGQPNFTSSTANNGGVSASTLNGPAGVYSDGTKLYVADSNNRRILIWNTLPTTNQQPADVVVGQPNFVTTSAGTTASKFGLTQYVLSTKGKLIIVDNNWRVLIYNSVPTTNGASADVVIGQTDMTTGSFGGLDAAHFGTAGSASARGLAVYNNKLIIADNPNSRVLIYNSIPITNGVSADVVIGQPNMTSNTADNGGISCATIEGVPGEISVTPNGRLLIPDDGRLLIFNQIPTSNFQSADIVLGKPDCVTRTAGVSNKLTNTRIRGAIEFDQKLFISDASNNRVLIFSNQLPDTKLTNSLVSGIANGLQRFKGTASTNVTNAVVKQVEFSVNGNDSWTGAQPTDGDFDEPSENYFFDFDPKSGNPDVGKNVGFTVRVRNTHNNTIDVSSSAFYFEPFVVNSPGDKTYTSSSLPTFSFSINTWRQQDLFSNLDRFRVSVNKNNTGFVPYVDTIPVSYEAVRNSGDNLQKSVVATTGNGTYEDKFKIVTYTNNNGTIQITPKAVDSSGNTSDKYREDGGGKLSGGSYQWKIEAIDRAGNVQETETRTLLVGSRQIMTSRSWFPLTVTAISGIGGTLDFSTIHPQDISSTITLPTSQPTFIGIAVAGALVTATIDGGSPVSTTTGGDSRYTLTIPPGILTVGTTHTLSVSVKDTGDNYNELPTFQLQVGGSFASAASTVQGEATTAGEKKEDLVSSPSPTPVPTPTPPPTESGVRRCFLRWCW